MLINNYSFVLHHVILEILFMLQFYSDSLQHHGTTLQVLHVYGGVRPHVRPSYICTINSLSTETMFVFFYNCYDYKYIMSLWACHFHLRFECVFNKYITLTQVGVPIFFQHFPLNCLMMQQWIQRIRHLGVAGLTKIPCRLLNCYFNLSETFREWSVRNVNMHLLFWSFIQMVFGFPLHALAQHALSLTQIGYPLSVSSYLGNIKLVVLCISCSTFELIFFLFTLYNMTAYVYIRYKGEWSQVKFRGRVEIRVIEFTGTRE